MRVSQLRAFVAAADERSFSAAGRRLAITQPTVSQLIRSLEDECGMQLFARTGGGLELTSAGESILPWARQAVASVAGTEEAARALRGLRGGTVSFGVMRNVDYYVLTQLALEFHRRHPAVKLRLVGINSYAVAESVRTGVVEAGVAVLPVPDHDLDVTPLGADEVVWVSADPERTREPMTVERIAERPLVLYDAHFGSNDPTRRQLMERAQRKGVDLEPVVEVESALSALRLAALGVGDTMVARAITRMPEFPSTLHITPMDPPMKDALALLCRRGIPLSPPAQELVEIVRQVMRM